MFGLSGDRCYVMLTSGRFFLGSGTHLHATASSVKADAIDCRLVDPGVVNVSIDVDVYAANGLVVEEMSVVPAASVIAMTKITVAVANPAVETNLCSPVAIMEEIPAVVPTPVTWSPEIADFGRHDPCSGDPIIIVVTVGPITRGPDVAVSRGYGLLIDWQLRRGDPDRYSKANLGGRSRRNSQQYQCEHKRANRQNKTHCVSLRLMTLCVLEIHQAN